jgi:TM2 domain-containing membrane protein YozV
VFSFSKLSAQTSDSVDTKLVALEDSLKKNNSAQHTADSLKIPIAKKYKRKWVAALLAFPLPFGMVGLHRIYLGTQPHIPIVYVATIGGVFGLLPLADFIAILSSSEEEINTMKSGKVFFWIKQ